MDAKKCDRCKIYYDIYNVAKNKNEPNGIMFVSKDERNHYWDYPIKDLCPECMRKLKIFMEEV